MSFSVPGYNLGYPIAFSLVSRSFLVFFGFYGLASFGDQVILKSPDLLFLLRLELRVWVKNTKGSDVLFS